MGVEHVAQELAESGGLFSEMKCLTNMGLVPWKPDSAPAAVHASVTPGSGAHVEVRGRRQAPWRAADDQLRRVYGVHEQMPAAGDGLSLAARSTG